MARIRAADVKITVQSLLDAEGSDHYTDPQDYIPATNDTCQWLASALNAGLGKERFSERGVVYLLKELVWQTDLYGRINLLQEAALGTNGPILDVIAIYAEPLLQGPSTNLVPAPDWVSVPRLDLMMIRPGFPVKRITDEQLAMTRQNTFMEGSPFLSSTDLRSYYFRWLGQNATIAYPVQGPTIEVGPVELTGKVLVGMSYLKTPVTITDMVNGTLDFPTTLLPLVSAKVLNFMSVKQGDGTNDYGVGRNWTDELYQLLAS